MAITTVTASSQGVDLSTLTTLASALGSGNPFAFGFWIRTLSTARMGVLSVEVGAANSSFAASLYMYLNTTFPGGTITTTSGAISFGFGDNGDNGYVYYITPTGVTINDGNPHFIVIVGDSNAAATGKVTFYIDGVLATGTITRPFDNTAGTTTDFNSNVRLCAHKATTSTYNAYLGGDLEDFTIWLNTTISAAQVMELYALRGCHSFLGGIHRRYTLANGAQDASLNNVAGTLVASPVFTNPMICNGFRRRAA